MKDFALLNLAQTLYGQPHAITLDKLRQIVAAFERRRAGLALSAEEQISFEDARENNEIIRASVVGAKLRTAGGMTVQQVGKVAILPMQGTITQRASFFTSFSGGCSAEQFAMAHEELVNDGSVKAIVWDVDSPGGSVAGVPETASKLLAMKGQKKTVAVSNTTMASAAYWLASNADEIVATPSSLTGSIGVLAVHEDYSQQNAAAGVAVNYIHAGKYKVEGNPDQPLTDDGRAALQQTVDDYYNLFVKGVAKARGVTENKVRSGYGEGRAITADRAVEAGLADRVGTLESVLKKLGAYEGSAPAGAILLPGGLSAKARLLLAEVTD
ncbi:S49 family peptidase [Zavarzinella formosa]|uniref:S49 family peptidase n=1 Tax=Zavarzinella formosa TaxID=360055 RepID=UPI0002DE09ED|nr:S49 family peptidase [Zavarzinella formosa]